MNEANFFFFFAVQVLRRKSGVYIFKVPRRDNESNYKWRKDNEGENPKNNIFVVKYIILKIDLQKKMCKKISSLFLQNSLEAYRNSVVQPN